LLNRTGCQARLHLPELVWWNRLTRVGCPGIDPLIIIATSDHRSESLPDYDLGTIHHLINDVGDAHQLLRLTNRFTRQQTHLLKIARELRRRWKSAKSLHGKLLSKKPLLTDDRKLRFRNHLVWWRIVTPFPLPHDAVAQPTGRSVRKLRTKDEMARSI